MWTLLSEPFSFDFMQQALSIGLLVSVTSGVLSCFLIMKGWSLMGDAVSHAVLPGVVLGYLMGLPILVGAFITGMLCTLATGYLSANSRIKEDTVMGVVFSGLFASGVVLYTQVQPGFDIHDVLFGDMLGVIWQDVGYAALVLLPSLVVLLVFRKDLMVFAFDPEHANVVGLNIRLLHYGLLVILSLVIVASIKAVGIILVIAVLIAPGAISYLLVNRFESMVWLSIPIAFLSTVLGVTASYHLNSAPAPTIVMVLSILFILTFLFSPKHGLIRRRPRPNTRPSTGPNPPKLSP